MEIEKIIGHIRDRDYMSGIEREQSRVKVTNEIFTPTTRAITDIYKLPSILFSDPTKKFQDQCCGDGQFLGEVLIRKIENGIEFETALSTIYGVDLMPDNVRLCQDRLLCGREDLRHIVEKNIVCADALRYHYRFDGSHPYDDETKTQTQQKLINNFFDFA